MKKILTLLFILCSLQGYAQDTSVSTQQDATEAGANAPIRPADTGTATTVTGSDATAAAAAAAGNANNTGTDGAPAATDQSCCEDKAALARADMETMKTYWGLDKAGTGSHTAKQLIYCILGLSILIILLLGTAFYFGGFSLKEALSENIQHKKTICNPEYSAEKMKDWLRQISSQTLNDLKVKLVAADAALVLAQAAVTAAGPTPTDAQTSAAASAASAAAAAAAQAQAQAVKDEAQKTYDTALQSAASGSLSTAALTNLANLFPAVIEISGETGAGNYRPSISRLIALLSAIMLFIVGLSATCFFLYYYLANGIAPDLSKLSAVLIAFGFGIAPYTLNKVANAATSKDKTI